MCMFHCKEWRCFFKSYMFFRSEVGRIFKLDPWVRGLILHQNEHSVVNVVFINILFHCIYR